MAKVTPPDTAPYRVQVIQAGAITDDRTVSLPLSPRGRLPDSRPVASRVADELGMTLFPTALDLSPTTVVWVAHGQDNREAVIRFSRSDVV